MESPISCTNQLNSVTIASILRLVYMVHRFYLDPVGDSLFTEFQVNLIRYHDPCLSDQKSNLDSISVVC